MRFKDVGHGGGVNVFDDWAGLGEVVFHWYDD